MSTSAAPAPERTDPARDGAPGRTRNDGDRDWERNRDPEPAPDRRRDQDGRPAGEAAAAPRETAAAPLWLLAGVEQDEGPEPHIRRGID